MKHVFRSLGAPAPGWKSMLCALLFMPAAIQAQEILELIEKDEVQLEDARHIADEYFQKAGTGKGKGYKIFKRWEYHAQRNIQENGRLISRSKIKAESDAFEQKWQQQQMMFSANSFNGNFTELGPRAWSSSTGWNPGIGRITSIGVAPSNAQIIYIGSPGGGIWKTTDGGNNWVVKTDQLSSNQGWALTVHPTDPNTVFWGDNNGTIFKSTDGGDSWTEILNTSSTVRSILIHPSNPNIMFATLKYNGLYRSTDGGNNWTEVLNGTVEDVVFKPGDTNTVYACGNSFYKSTDGGASFSAVNTGFQSTSERMKLAVTDADPNYVYICQKKGSGFGYLYRSTDSGNSFSVMSDHTDGNYIGSQASRDMAICVSNTNKNEVHIGGFEMYKSTNGGSSWVREARWTYPNSTGYVHADIEVLQYLNGVIYVGSDGGIFTSTNQGGDFTDKTTGIGIRQFYRISSSATDPQIVAGGAQDNGSSIMYGNNHNFRNWVGADGMESVVDYTQAYTVYGTIQFGSLYKTTNLGVSNASIVQPPEAGSGSWVIPLEMDPADHNTIYAGYNALYKHTNGASSGSWTNISSGVSFGGKLVHVKIAPSNNQVIYATSGYNVWKTTNGQAASPNWTACASTSGYINSISVDPTDANRLIVGTSYGNLYLSTNAGTSWTQIQGNLPNTPLTAVLHDGTDKNGMYVGTNTSIYYKNDDLSSWIPFDTNFPKVSVQEMDLYTNSAGDNKLRVATYGRGLWESPTYETNGSGGNNGGNDPTFAYTLQIQTDNYPSETNWTIKDPNGNAVATGGGYTTSNNLYTVSLQLTAQCYDFEITDSYGDGICCSYGNGFYKLINNSDNSEVFNGGNFQSSDTKNFCVTAPITTHDVNLSLTLDNYPTETAWTIKNDQGTTVASGGSYTNSQKNTTVTETATLDTGCYTLEFTDSYGDGICCSHGNGSYSLTETNGGASLASGGEFTNSVSHNFCVPSTPINPIAPSEVPIHDPTKELCYPNPLAEELTIDLTGFKEPKVSIALFDVTGKILYQKDYTTGAAVQARFGQLAKGVYTLRIQSDIRQETIHLYRE